MELNEQIKKYRTEMNLSQEELAEKIFWKNAKIFFAERI